jgi:putative sterol carrier protein
MTEEKMTEDAENFRNKRFSKNPFMRDLTKAVLKSTNIKAKNAEIRTLKEDNKVLLVGMTGEYDQTAAMVIQHSAVEKKQFVKMFGAGISLLNELDKSATKLFIEVLEQVQDNQGTDLLFLNYKKTTLSRPTFYKAVAVLIERKLLAQAEAPGMYWLNPVFLWNGNRLRFVQEFVKKEEKEIKAMKAIQEQQTQMNLLEMLGNDAEHPF